MMKINIDVDGCWNGRYRNVMKKELQTFLKYKAIRVEHS
jgi:hypothetical protein